MLIFCIAVTGIQNLLGKAQNFKLVLFNFFYKNNSVVTDLQ